MELLILTVIWEEKILLYVKLIAYNVLYNK